MKTPSSAHILAFIALFASLSGTSYAAGKLIVTGRDIRDNTVSGLDVQNGSISESDLSAPVREKLNDDCSGEAGSCGNGNGSPSAGQPFGEIPSGTTVTGVWGGRMMPSTTAYVQWTVSLPGIAPVELTNETVNAAPSELTRDEGGENCTGSSRNPTAPRGQVCLYIEYVDGQTTEVRGYGHTKYGFVVDALISPRKGPAGVYGTWAYTAA